MNLSQQKKRQKKIFDTNSDDAFSGSQTSQSSSSSQPQKTYVPRFLLINAEKENDSIPFLSPFLVHKTMINTAGEPKGIKNLRYGDTLIQCPKEKHEMNFLKMKIFCGHKCTVTPHSSLNISKSFVRCPALNKQSIEHILEVMAEQCVTDVRRINVFCDGVKKPTNTFVFTFNTPVLLSVVKICFIQGT